MKAITIKDEDYYVTSTEGLLETAVKYDTLPMARAAALEETKRTGLNHLVVHVVGSITIETEL